MATLGLLSCPGPPEPGNGHRILWRILFKMARVCEQCGKGPATGNMVSHSKRRTRRRWLPNLQSYIKMDASGVKTVRICTRCLRSLKHAAMRENDTASH